jgi:tight adherence protein C
VTSLEQQVLLALAGGVTGAGVAVLWRSVRLTRPDVAADLDAMFAAPRTTPTGRQIDRPGRALTELALRHGLRNVLLADDLALAGRPVETHTTARLVHVLAGATAAVAGWMITALVLPVHPMLAVVAVAFGGLLGISAADRRVRALARQRRREAQPAVAAYLDLVRILLAGGLPLQAALRAAADQGSGWTFAQLRHALTWAHDRGAAPDEAFRHLAERFPLPEFADLALTITSARRGASPVQALESKAAFWRGAHAAQVRADIAVADAQIELPGALVALAFVAFLTYPFLTLITSTTGVVP